MFDVAIGLLQAGMLILTAVALYFVADLIRELKEAREYAREQNEINRHHKGKWP